jgi:hypothetical protein
MTRAPRLLLGLLLLLIVAGAALAPWRSTMGVDDRTMFESIAAVADHGSPGITVEGAERHIALRPRWNYPHGGKLWSQYPPFYPYLMAIPYRIAGLRGVVAANILGLGLLALGLFALGRRFTGSEMAGTATAWVTIVAAPIWACSFVASGFTYAIVAITWAVYFALRIHDDPDAKRWPFLVGVLGGFASGCHLLAFPMWAVLWGVTALVPTRSIKRSLWGLAGVAIPFSILAAFNHHRFGSWNPISYGPCIWRQCDDGGLHGQGLAVQLRWALPFVAWAVAAAGTAWVVRRSRLALGLVAAIALGVLLSTPALRTRAIDYATVTWALLADVSRLELGGDFFSPADGLGVFLGPWVIKSVLQCTPLLALAALHRPTDRARTAMVALPCAALFATIILRANIPLAFALGYPFLHYRYAMFGLPLLVLLAVAAARDLPWRKIDLAIGALFAIAVAIFLSRSADDFSLPRRVLLLRGSLLLGFAAFVLAARFRSDGNSRWGRAAALATALAAGFGFAATTSVDLRALASVRRDNDARLERFLAATPQRFALIGWPREIDPVLAAERDRSIEYGDLYELQDWREVRPLLDEWRKRGLRIFFLQPRNPPPAPWPDLRYRDVDPGIGLVELVNPV